MEVGVVDGGHASGRGFPSPASNVSGQARFESFFVCYEQPLYGYLRRMLGAEEDAVEIAQETFFRAWQHFDEISAYDRPQGWLYQVATRLALNHVRKQRSRSFLRLFHWSTASPEEEWLAHPVDVERQTIERDLIAGVLRRLPPRQRAALLLRVVHGLSGEEIAQALASSPAATRKLLSRAREQFRLLYIQEVEHA